MYIIVAGGGKVGYHLARALMDSGHELLVIEQDAAKCERIADDLGDIVVHGDACEVSLLGDAGTSRAPGASPFNDRNRSILKSR